tara:strand:- start:309 stop:479 length:171 start_codon:yes stop_codon:yes gene_type:complete
MSAPCVHCHNLIKKAGIQKIKYIDHHENIVSVKTSEYTTNHHSSGMTFLRKNNIIK